jgi:hypothetical protein
MPSAPASLRNAFLNLVEDETSGDAACQLTSQLLECDDVLPYEYCEILELPSGTTFGQAAAKVRSTLGCAAAG